jgi:outer membrane protein TolC
MKFQLVIASVSFGLLFSIHSRADELAIQHLSYEEAAVMALRDNPDLLAIRDAEEGFKLRSKQALSPNNPVFSYTRADVPGFSLSQEAAQTVYQINYTLGFPGKAFSQSATIRHQAESTREQALGKEVDLLVALSNNYIAFSVNQTFRKILIDEQKKDAELLKLLEKKYAASQAAKVDLLNAKVVSETIAQSILANQNDYDILVTQFLQLIRRPGEKGLLPIIPEKIIIPPVGQSFEELTGTMSRNRHSIIAAEKSVEGSQSSLTNTDLQAFPDFQFTAGVNNWISSSAAPNPGVLRDYTFGIAMSVPIFFPFNELVGIHAAQTDLGTAEALLDSARIQAVADLQTTYTSLIAADRELNGLEKLVLPAARESYGLTALTYSLGKADYFMLNQSRNTWLDSERQMLSKKQQVANLYNQLVDQVGCDITRTEGPHACH